MRQLKTLDPHGLDGLWVLRAAQVHALFSADDILRQTEIWRAEQESALTARIDADCAQARGMAYHDALGELRQAVAAYRDAVTALDQRLEGMLHTCLLHLLGQTPPHEVMRAALRPVLAALHADDDVVIAVHPGRVADLRAALADLSDIALARPWISIEPVETLTESRCVIYSRSDVIDISIEVLADQLLTAVLGLSTDAANALPGAAHD